MSNSIAALTAASFEPHQGETFRLVAADREVELTLSEVQRLGHALRAGGAFSLQFQAPAGPLLPQAIYPLHHKALGALDLFVVPLQPKDGINRYEVIFT